MIYGFTQNGISIHAAREGGDSMSPLWMPADNISIHAAREGGDAADLLNVVNEVLFQSTPPVKAATRSRQRLARFNRFQSTPPVKAATRPGQQNPPKFEFQSTPPVKAATLCNTDRVRACRISIHAAREGGDTVLLSLLSCCCHFNPRRP